MTVKEEAAVAMIASVEEEEEEVEVVEVVVSHSLECRFPNTDIIRLPRRWWTVLQRRRKRIPARRWRRPLLIAGRPTSHIVRPTKMMSTTDTISGNSR